MKKMDLFGPANRGVAEVEISYINTVPQQSRYKISGVQAVKDLFRDVVFDDATIDYRESFYAVYANRKNEVLGFYCIGKGGVASTAVDIRLVMQAGLLLNASCFFVSHNHPSGTCLPSREDDNVTKKLKDAGKLMDMPLLDHIIIARDSFFSYSDSGTLEYL